MLTQNSGNSGSFVYKAMYTFSLNIVPNVINELTTSMAVELK